jgi:hypothetical protein
VLVREGFSLGALFFGPLWLFAHHAWIPSVLTFSAGILAVLAPSPFPPVLLAGLAWLTGVFGTDMIRWSLARRGFVLVHVVAAASQDAAFARLMAARPDLAVAEGAQ